MNRALTTCALVAVILGVSSSRAQAQSAPAPAAATGTDAASDKRAGADRNSQAPSNAPALPADQQAAAEENRARFQRAENAYERGEYETALELFESLYEQTRHPALLFNMAQAHRMAGPDHCLDAHRLYLEYLVDDSQPPNGQEVRERVKELEPCARAADERKRAEKADKDRDLASTGATVSPAVAAVTITGGALLLTGIGLFTAAKIRFSDARKECPCEPGAFSTWETAEKIGVGAMAVGGAGLAIGGVSWWASVNPTGTDEVVWLGVSGRF